MCGILASTDRWAHNDEEWERALSSLASRGPDASGQCTLNGVRLGHCRLEIIGIGGPGAQPMLSTSGRQALVFNGEIYNYRELALRLGVPAESDTRVLLEILTRDIRMLSQVRGMYAFVFWDAETQTLTAARDAAGIKPLYYLRHPSGEVTLASTLAPLMRLTDSGDEDQTSIVGWLASGFFPAGTSPLRNVSKLEPGIVHTWRGANGAWQLTAQALAFAPSSETLNLRSELVDSVRNHLVSDVPVGVLLSGGVDSTLLAAVASAYSGPLHTYTLVNPKNPQIDESDFAQTNARALGAIHVEVEATPSELARQAFPLIKSSGEPFSDAAFLPLALLCERVAQDLKVVLAGEGADEVFGGYRRYDLERLLAEPTGARISRGAQPFLAPLGTFARRLPSKLSRSVLSVSTPPGYLRHSTLMGGRWGLYQKAFPDLYPDVLVRYQSLWADPKSLWNLKVPDYQRFDLRQWLPNVYLEKSDRASMLHSVEVRVPFLDPRVVSVAATLNIRDTRKRALRAVLRDFLPKAALPDRKMGLSVSSRQLISTEQFRDHAETELSGPRGIAASIDDVVARSAFTQDARGNPSTLFQLATLGMWREANRSS